MRISLTLALALSAGTAAAQPDLGFDECGCGKAHMLRHLEEQGFEIHEQRPIAYSNREAFTDTDLLHTDLDIEIVPATDNISGSNVMRVRSLSPSLTQFTFMLRSNFTVSSLTVDGTPAAVAGPAGNSYARTITLPRAYGLNEEFTVSISYSGTAVSRGFGSITFGTQNGVDLVSTLSEAYYAATWWPIKDGDVFLPGNNADKFTMSLAVTAPSALRTVSNGLLAPGFPQTLSGGRSKYKWQSDIPIAPYLVAFSSTNYNTWTRTYSYPLQGGGTGTMPVEFNIYPASDTAGNRAAWEKCLDMLAAYRPVYGEYPFVSEKYGIYQFPFGGGMEHQTNTGQGTFSESVTAHELAHQWWGDNVTCKTWNHIWLNEGFATFTEAVWEERKPGSAGLPAYLAAMVARKPAQVGDSVYVYDTSNMNRIFSSTYTYRKGGWVLHQLRKLMGDTAFFDAMNEYRAEFQGSAATTEDFFSVASALAGQDLTWFSQQWVYGVGAPEYSYGWQNVSINGQDYLALSLSQTQNAAWPGSPAQTGYFRAGIDVRVDTSGGPVTVPIQNTARSQWYLLPLGAPATGVTLDEFDWVLNTGKVGGAYQNGPPKVVAVSPAPGSSTAVAPSSLSVTFSEPVTVPGGAVRLTGPGGAVAGGAVYDAPTRTATFTPSSGLAPGAYTISVDTSVNSTAAGLALDGEFAGVLPSGDGLAGGAASFGFVIEPAPGCDPDVNQDGNVDQDDVSYLINVVGGGDNPTGIDPDFNSDGNVDQDDVAALLNVVAGGDCP